MAAAAATAQDSAPSSHMVFDDNFPGDIIINQVRVPQSGQAMYTYYEALGWRGKAAGYAGIQVHPRGHNFIFSIWDHPEHRKPIAAVHRGPGTLTERFGGEGTGLKSWNFELGWKPDVWHTLVARVWSAKEDGEECSELGFWTLAGDSKQWTHLVTMRVAVAEAAFQGGTDAFIEDWLNTGKAPRTTHLRGGWKRKLDGAWHPFQSARYFVNARDLVPGKRSYNYRQHWNGGIAEDQQGKHYFMVAGGKETKPTTENPSRHALPRQERSPAFPPIAIQQLRVKRRDGRVELAWKNDPATLPQFAFQWRLTDTAKAPPPDEAAVIVVPHQRSTSVQIPARLAASKSVVVQFRVQDILGHWSKWQAEVAAGQ